MIKKYYLAVFKKQNNIRLYIGVLGSIYYLPYSFSFLKIVTKFVYYLLYLLNVFYNTIHFLKIILGPRLQYKIKP